MLLALALLGCAATEPEKPSEKETAAADPLADSREIDQKIHELEKRTPGSSEVNEIYRKLRDLTTDYERDAVALEVRAQNLSNTVQWMQFEKERAALERQRDDKWNRERRPFIQASKKIYSDRHQELRASAVAELPELRKLSLDVLSFPRLDGSTSTQPLSVILASRAMNIPYEWDYPEPTGSPWSRWREVPDVSRLPGFGRWDERHAYEFQIANARVFAKADLPARDRVAVMINSLLAANSSTHDGLMNLLKNKSDLVLTVRGPSASEQDKVKQSKSAIQLTPIALDALVFIVNQKNPVANLSLRQVRDIYQLKLTQWHSMTDKRFKGAIAPFIREPESGSRELFDALVMKDTKAAVKDEDFRIANLYADSMAGPFNSLTTEEKGIGYSVWYYEHFMAASPYTRTVSIDGQTPTAQTIASGKYPLTFPIYAACRESDPPDSPAKRLLAYILSAEGQAIVKESGYVPVSAGQRK